MAFSHPSQKYVPFVTDPVQEAANRAMGMIGPTYRWLKVTTGTSPTDDDHCHGQLCDDRSGTNPVGSILTVQILPVAGCDANVAANDVILVWYDTPNAEWICASDVMDDAYETVRIWAGLVGNIPRGWYVCDGDNGTEDLRHKFIAGYDPDDDTIGDDGGGAETHVHVVAGHTHTQNLASIMEGTEAPVSGISVEPLVGTVDSNTAAASNLPPHLLLAFIQRKY